MPESEEQQKPSRVVITFEDGHSALCRIDIENVNPMQMFSAVKQFEIVAETLYMQQQMAADQKRIIPVRDHLPKGRN